MGGARLCLRACRLPRTVRVGWGVLPLSPGRAGRPRHAGVDRRPAVVQRQDRHRGRVLRRALPVAARASRQPAPDRDGAARDSRRLLRQHPLHRRRVPTRAIAAVVGHLHDQHGGAQLRTDLRQRPHIPAPPVDRHGRRRHRQGGAVVPGLAGASDLRRLLERDRHLRQVRQDRRARLHPVRLVRRLSRRHVPTLERHEQARQDGAGAQGPEGADGPVDPRRAGGHPAGRPGLRGALIPQDHRGGEALVRLLAQGHRQRGDGRAAAQDIRDGRERMAVRERVAAGPDAVHPVLPAQRRQGQLGLRRRDAVTSMFRRTNIPIRSTTTRTGRCPA